jgi:hypothetical protein
MYWRIYIMKKRLLVLLFVVVLCLSGCQSEEEAKKEAIQNAFEDIGMEHSTVIMNVLSKEWTVIGAEDTYTFTKEGTGNISGETFTYSCGFDEENNIALKIVMDKTTEEKYYYVSTDDTGYGLNLDLAGEEKDVYLFQSNVELLDLTDERAAVMVGEWADKSDNRYVFNEDGSMLIKGSQSETEGTFSVVEWKEDGSLLLTLVFGSDTMEFNYEILSDGTTVQLCRPGTDVIHTWIKK